MRQQQEYTVLIEQDEEGYYVAEVPELRPCYTQARTLDALLERIREAIQLRREEAIETPRLRFVGIQRVAV